MCGIAGICNFNDEPVADREISVLIKALKHRGPDGDGHWSNSKKNCVLVHTRLSILDLSENARQPMSYLNDRYWISLNGEIYNFVEIKEELEQKGYEFKTRSDTEVVIAAWHEWGKDALDRFNGMWAFAIYDSENDGLFISRDRFGVKPLYYYHDNNRIIFSSEVQAIHQILGPQHPLFEPVMKDIAMGSFNNHGTIYTYLENVYVLPGGHNLTIENNKISTEQWYSLPKRKVPKTFKKQVSGLKELVVDACKIRLRSDVPVGTCLSGGVDSGSITALINKFESNKESRFNHYTHRGFCASFPKSHTDEREQAQFLADTLGSTLDVITVDPPTRKELEQAMSQCDGPMHALAFYPIWLLYKYIKSQGITVTLDGQGPDEMLGGYRPVRDAMAAAIELVNPIWFFDVYDTYSSQGEKAQFSAKQFVKQEFHELIKTYKKQAKIRVKNNIKKVLNRYPNNSHHRRVLDPVAKVNWLPNKFDQSLFQQFFHAPLPGILNQYDRCSMANGVECRMPFMDYRIVEFIFSLPVTSKVGHGYTKRVLREAMKDILPDRVRLDKNKIGFNAPIVNWFLKPLKEFMQEIMNTPEFKTSPYFNAKVLRQNFDDFLNSEKPMWNTAWQFWGAVHVTWWIIKLKKSIHE